MSIRGVAIVTGAAQGIGRAIALRLADDGFDVAINDLGSAKENLETLHQEIVSKGRKSFICIGDMSEEDQVAHLVDEAAKELGDIEVVGYYCLQGDRIIYRDLDGSKCRDNLYEVTFRQ